MKAEELLAVYCTGSLFILESKEIVIGILQDSGVKRKDAERAYALAREKQPFGYIGADIPPADTDALFRAGMRYLRTAEDAVQFRKAYWTLYAAAVRGHAEALFRLGMLMGGEYGDCPFADTASAVKFFRKAIEKGCGEAKVHLALLTADGFRPDSVGEAVSLMEAEVSAADSSEDSEEFLRILGELMDGDRASALEKLDVLSGKGVSEASVILDAVFREGYGVPKDPEKAQVYRNRVIG